MTLGHIFDKVSFESNGNIRSDAAFKDLNNEHIADFPFFKSHEFLHANGSLSFECIAKPRLKPDLHPNAFSPCIRPELCVPGRILVAVRGHLETGSRLLQLNNATPSLWKLLGALFKAHLFACVSAC